MTPTLTSHYHYSSFHTMASFWNQLSFFLLLQLLISPQIQAREGKLFSLFSHFRTIYNVKDPLEKSNAESPALAPGPALELELEPVSAPTPTPEPETVPTPAPSAEHEIGSTIPSGPAPEPEFSDTGEGYGLYGRGSYSQYSPTKDTPTTTFQNELLNEDFNYESYKTSYPKTNFYNNNNNNEEEYNNNEEYKTNDNTKEEYRNTYIGGYSNNNNYNGKENYYNNNNYNDKENYYNNNNGYEEKREGMSDTRFLENGKYYYPVHSVNENYNLNGYESAGRGSTTENEGYYEKSQYPNEFNTMEEYEKQQEEQGYTP